MTALNGSTGNPRRAVGVVPDPAPPELSLEPPLVDRNGWDWVDRDGQVATALAGLLEKFVEYFNARYAWTTEHLIPPCWAAHGALIEEITTLMWSRWSAFESPHATPEAAQPIDLVRKGQNVVGSCFARNVTPKKWIHPNNQ